MLIYKLKSFTTNISVNSISLWSVIVGIEILQSIYNITFAERLTTKAGNFQ